MKKKNSNFKMSQYPFKHSAIFSLQWCKTHAWLRALIESIYFCISPETPKKKKTTHTQAHTHSHTPASVTFSSFRPSHSTFSLTFILLTSLPDSLSLSQSTEFSGNPSQSLQRPFTLRGTFSPLVAPQTFIHFPSLPSFPRSNPPQHVSLSSHSPGKTNRNNFFLTRPRFQSRKPLTYLSKPSPRLRGLSSTNRAHICRI